MLVDVDASGFVFDDGSRIGFPAGVSSEAATGVTPRWRVFGAGLPKRGFVAYAGMAKSLFVGDGLASRSLKTLAAKG